MRGGDRVSLDTERKRRVIELDIEIDRVSGEREGGRRREEKR